MSFSKILCKILVLPSNFVFINPMLFINFVNLKDVRKLSVWLDDWRDQLTPGYSKAITYYKIKKKLWIYITLLLLLFKVKIIYFQRILNRVFTDYTTFLFQDFFYFLVLVKLYN